MDKDLFCKELENLINLHSLENGCNTPDHILADYLKRCLDAFEVATNARDKWWGHAHWELPKGSLKVDQKTTMGEDWKPKTPLSEMIEKSAGVLSNEPMKEADICEESVAEVDVSKVQKSVIRDGDIVCYSFPGIYKGVFVIPRADGRFSVVVSRTSYSFAERKYADEYALEMLKKAFMEQNQKELLDKGKDLRISVLEQELEEAKEGFRVLKEKLESFSADKKWNPEPEKTDDIVGFVDSILQTNSLLSLRLAALENKLMALELENTESNLRCSCPPMTEIEVYDVLRERIPGLATWKNMSPTWKEAITSLVSKIWPKQQTQSKQSMVEELCREVEWTEIGKFAFSVKFKEYTAIVLKLPDDRWLCRDASVDSTSIFTSFNEARKTAEEYLVKMFLDEGTAA